MLLPKVINGSEKSQFILIEDSVDHSGFGLLRAIVCNISHRIDTVHTHLYETGLPRFTRGLPCEVTDKLAVTDLSDDLFGWLSGTSSHLQSTLPSFQAVRDKRVAVVIDCISNLVSHNSADAVCQMLTRLRYTTSAGGGTLEHIVCIVHGDLHDSRTLLALEHCADCVLKVAKCPTTDGSSSFQSGICSITVKRPSGKFITADELYRIDENFNATSTECDIAPLPSNPLHAAMSVPKSKPARDPTANLTFNLKMKPDELEARDKVVLPFLSAADKGLVADMEHLDVDEDLEDDPDDDLDI